MNNTDLIVVILLSMGIGQSVLSILILLTRDTKYRFVNRPLAIFFAANMFTLMTGYIEPFGYENTSALWVHVVYALSLPMLLALGPAIWLYVKALTNENNENLKGKIIHFIPSLFACFVVVYIIFSSTETRLRVFVDGYSLVSIAEKILVSIIIMLQVFFTIQASLYIYCIIRSLLRFKSRLEDLFADTVNKDLTWMYWVILYLCFYWSLDLVDSIVDISTEYSMLSNVMLAAMELGLIMSVSLFGLQQKPIFDTSGDLGNIEEIMSATGANNNSKYNSSALSSEDKKRISKKIDAAMQDDKLYQDPNLSLPILSKHIKTNSNYVSQTLNEEIGETFFDYVNKWRVEEAIELIKTTDDTILAISLKANFNSRSSFYKVFKRHTDMTPKAYREKFKSQN